MFWVRIKSRLKGKTNLVSLKNSGVEKKEIALTNVQNLRIFSRFYKLKNPVKDKIKIVICIRGTMLYAIIEMIFEHLQICNESKMKMEFFISFMYHSTNKHTW